jgi:hypothetical protein
MAVAFRGLRLAGGAGPSKRRVCCDLLSWQAADAALYRSRRGAAAASWTNDSSECRCSGLGVAQLGSERWRCTVAASLLLIDEIDCPRVRRSLT